MIRLNPCDRVFPWKYVLAWNDISWQIAYGRINLRHAGVRVVGLEPTAWTLAEPRSSQLSYTRCRSNQQCIFAGIGATRTIPVSPRVSLVSILRTILAWDLPDLLCIHCIPRAKNRSSPICQKICQICQIAFAFLVTPFAKITNSHFRVSA
jgi:hypothetical protein